MFSENESGLIVIIMIIYSFIFKKVYLYCALLLWKSVLLQVGVG